MHRVLHMTAICIVFTSSLPAIQYIPADESEPRVAVVEWVPSHHPQ